MAVSIWEGKKAEELIQVITDMGNRMMFSNAAKTALLNMFQHTAYIDENSRQYYDALEAALYAAQNVVSISAVFNAGGETIYTGDSLDTLKQFLTVTAIDNNGQSSTVTDYAISGELNVGSNTITVSYGGKRTTFSVTAVWGYKLRTPYTISGSANVIDTGYTIANDEYTIAAEFEVDRFPATQTVQYLFGNKQRNDSTYIALQETIDSSVSPSKPIMWGFGLTWDEGANKLAQGVKMRIVITFDSRTAPVTVNQKYKLATASAISSASRNFTSLSTFDNGNTMKIGNEENTDISAVVHDFVLEKGIWTSSQITSYING